jgi:hypothetical protein
MHTFWSENVKKKDNYTIIGVHRAYKDFKPDQPAEWIKMA